MVFLRPCVARRLVLAASLLATAAAPAFAKTESPYGGTPWPVPGTIQAEDFDNGGQNVAFYNPDGANIYGQYRPKTTISIEASTDAGGGYDVAATRTGEWMNYTVKVKTAGTFTLQVRVASAGQGGTFHFLVDGVSATPTLAVPDTGGWQSWTTLATSITLGAGKHIVQLHFDQVSAATANIGNFNWISFTTASSGGAKQQVMSYLQGVSGNHTLVGQHNKFNNDPAGATDQVTAITGRAPAYWNADFGWGTDQIGNRQKMTNEAISQYRSGALTGLMFHTCAPTGDEYCSWDDIGTPGKSKQLTADQFTQLVTPGTALYNTWISRLDELVPFFQQIKDAGQAVMFRPLHEMNQCVFWWACHTGPNGSARLYQKIGRASCRERVCT